MSIKGLLASDNPFVWMGSWLIFVFVALPALFLSLGAAVLLVLSALGG